MSRSDPNILLAEMHEAAHRATSYVEGMSKAEFLSDTKTQAAVAMNLQNIGEATTVLVRRHPEAVAACTNVPWSLILGMQNRIAHGYFNLDMNVIWDTTQDTLPLLVTKISPAVEAFIKAFDARNSSPNGKD